MLVALVLVLMVACALSVWKDVVHQRSDGSLGGADFPRGAVAATRRTLRSLLPRSRKPLLPAEDRAPLPGRIRCSDLSGYVASGYQGIVVHLMQADRRRRA
ncbi:hypothetical protein [Trujillonella humicola]|uniref:hypothetical protein n=1 Tax=Trujillonella humicola TaxID=3383699 RepID=UPI003905E398